MTSRDDLDLRPWTGRDWWCAVLAAGCDLQAELQQRGGASSPALNGGVSALEIP
jgi:hypothetical protein